METSEFVFPLNTLVIGNFKEFLKKILNAYRNVLQFCAKIIVATVFVVDELGRTAMYASLIGKNP